jgi:hypothetical protein
VDDSIFLPINSAFFFVTDLIISLLSFFTGIAWKFGGFVLFIAIALAGINHAISGQGLKENIVKIVKSRFSLKSISRNSTVLRRSFYERQSQEHRTGGFTRL